VHRSFTPFLARALTLFEDEVPAVYRELARRVATREVRCDIDGDRITIRCDGHRLRLERRSVSPAVYIRTSRDVIVDLVEGGTSLMDAVWEERIFLRGELEDLVAFHDGLAAFLSGAVRCPAFPELLDDYLALAAGAPAVEAPRASEPAVVSAVPAGLPVPAAVTPGSVRGAA
jgi:hypothetical protein